MRKIRKNRPHRLSHQPTIVRCEKWRSVTTMLIVKIDTTVAKVAKVEIFNDSSVLTEFAGDSPVLAIKEALSQADLKISAIDRFESNPGPGSYTGVRIGAAVANTLNWVTGKKFPLTEPIYE